MDFGIRENLNKPVNHKTLEDALIEAAKETGLKLKERKKGVSENEGGTKTILYFGRKMSRAMEVVIQYHGDLTDFFRVYPDGWFGASEKTIKSYASRVHNYL